MRILRGTESSNYEPIDKPYLTKGELIRKLQEDRGSDDAPVFLKTWQGAWDRVPCIKTTCEIIGSQYRIMLQGEVE